MSKTVWGLKVFSLLYYALLGMIPCGEHSEPAAAASIHPQCRSEVSRSVSAHSVNG